MMPRLFEFNDHYANLPGANFEYLKGKLTGPDLERLIEIYEARRVYSPEERANVSVGRTGIRAAFGADLRIDSSSIGAITIEDDASVFIGSSKVTGPIVSGAGQLTCINVYDGNYQPITCD